MTGEKDGCARGARSLQEKAFDIVEADQGENTASRYFDVTILVFIMLNVVAVTLESVESIG